jgi:FtsZ-binding cell division protein ZapB
MEDMEQRLQRVEEKIQQLLKQHQYAQKEMQRLQKENNRLNEELQQKIEHANNLQQKAELLKVNTLNLDDHSKKDLEKRINSYLKEIDKCLSLLNT